jgi:uncharacterized RmlC-like cupin family protein
MSRVRTCRVIRPTTTYRGKQALAYFAGISAENAGAKGLCMHLVTIMPGSRAAAHYHRHHETAIYVLSGRAGMWFGRGLRQHLTVKAGEFLYIPANLPHMAYNPSRTTACVAVVARTDPREQESVVLYRGIPSRTTKGQVRRRRPRPASRS